MSFSLPRARGFSLIELLVVVAIIFVIAALAVPSFLRSRMAGNEASAASSLHAVNTAQVTYAAAYPNIGYASSLAALGGTGATPSPSGALLIDSVLGASSPGGADSGNANTKSGYSFYLSNATAINGMVSGYEAHGDPTVPGQTGARFFYSDPSNVTRFNLGGAAASTDAPLQ